MLSTIPGTWKPEQPSESQILSAAMAWLFRHGLEPIRNNTGAFTKEYKCKKTGVVNRHHVRVGKKGSGDILYCNRSGQWCELEIKRPGKKQEPHQVERQKFIESMQGLYLVIRSIDDLEAHKAELVG